MIDMFYMEWFFPLLIFYMCFAGIYLIYKYLIPSLFNKKLILSLFAITSLGLLLIYFILPVPQSAQQRFVIRYAYSLKINNDVKFDNFSKSLNIYCDNSYLNGYDFFKIQSALNKDLTLIYKRNEIYTTALPEGTLNGTGVCDYQNFFNS